MRLAEGIVIDEEKTFGKLEFSAMRREVFKRNAEGEQTGDIKERTYDLISSMAGMMIQVSVPGDVPARDFPYEAEVKLINPTVGTVANAVRNGADVNWYIKADDIVLKTESHQMKQQEPKKEKQADQQPKS